MNRFLLFVLLISYASLSAQTPCSDGMAGGYPCNGLDLQAYFSLSDLGASSGNDSWGWTDPNDGKEYAVVGLNNSTYFIDITDPVNPRRLGRMMTATSNTSWRDVKVYNNHAFVVSEATNHGMQVFDLTRLRGLSTSTTRTFAADAHYTGFKDAHNLIINESTGVAYILGARLNSAPGTNTVIFLDITNPTNPTLIDDYSGKGYTHDAQVVTYDGPDPDHQGKEIFIGANEDEVVILDVTNKSSVQILSTITYPNYYYTHQGWFTEDKRYFLLGDEEDETMGGIGNTKTIVLDLIDLDNPSIHFNYYGPTAAIDHNGYVRGNRFYQASYSAGVRVIKVDDIANQNMTEVASFDTWPSSNSASFNGAWNIYPYFESGNLIVSNYNTGFFILKDPNYDNIDPVVACQSITATLDKTTGTVTIDAMDIDGGSTDNMGIVKRTITGQTTFSCADVGGVFNVTLTVEDDYGNTASCNTTVTIAAETTEFNGVSWSNGTPDVGSNAKIASNYDTDLGGLPSFEACTCEIDDNRTLTIGANDYIRIEKDITVNGNLIVKHQGSVVQTDPSAVVLRNNGTGAEINVELTTPPLKKRDFMLMGSPMNLETRNGVYNSAFLVLEHTPSNFIPHPSVPAGATNFADDNGDAWNAMPSGSIEVGEAYIVRPQSGYSDPIYVNPGDAFTFDMTYTLGTLNNGTVVRNITFNGLGTNPDGTPNFLANPYASAIDAGLLINDGSNSLLNEVYFWEHLTPPSPMTPGANSMNFSMGDLSMYNGSMGIPAANDTGGSTTPNGVISTGQGFGMKAFGAGTVTFKNSMRLNTGNTTLRTPEGLEKITLRVYNQQYGLGSYTGIAFSPNGTAGLDPTMDSERLATFIALYSHLPDGSQQLGIQTRERYESGMKIPVGFDSQLTEEVSYVISITDIEGENLADATVYLIDTYKNTITDLTQSDYEFFTNKGQFSERFILKFESDSVLGSSEAALSSIVAYPNPTNTILNIVSPHTPIVSIKVADPGGRAVLNVAVEEQHRYQLDMSQLQSAVYFVRIDTGDGSLTKRIIKN